MKKIIHLPIEPLVERYSHDWLRWYQNHASDNDEFFWQPVYTEIKEGAFLDVSKTCLYKNKQIEMATEFIIQNKHRADGYWKGVVFFFHDLWHPGVMDLAYIRDGLGLPFRIAGCLHAGTYDRHDFLTKKGMERWGKYLENAILEAADMIFVATDFHKNLICNRRKANHAKIFITGFPIYDERDHNTEKEDWIVFPHRTHAEKNPAWFDELEEEFRKRGRKEKFVKTYDVCKTKEEYYDVLNKSKVALSFAMQETWGIAMQEAVFAGCIPYVPDRLSYKEMYPDVFRHPSNYGIPAIAEAVETFLDYRSNWEELLNETREKFLAEGREAIVNQMHFLGLL